ncbi:MAG: hypothetical protein ACLSA6_17190 [Holdemania massiliensis]
MPPAALTRMSGCNLPVVISPGSGNQGMTCSGSRCLCPGKRRQ